MKYFRKQQFSGMNPLSLCLFVTLAAARGQAETVDVTHGWRFSPEDRVASDTMAAAPSFDDTAWKTIDAGRSWEEQGFDGLDGAGWYRKAVHVPAEWKGRCIYLAVAEADDGYDLFVNGVAVRSSHEKEEVRRQATVSAVQAFLEPGENNLLAIRVLDRKDRGGLTGRVALSTDKRAFTWEPLVLKLAAGWRFGIDPDRKGVTEGWFRPDADDARWSAREISGDGWRKWDGLQDYKGQAWYRTRFRLAGDWNEPSIYLKPVSVEGKWAVYLNGRLVMSRGMEHPADFPRMSGAREEPADARSEALLDVAAALDRAGENLLAVRVDCDGNRRGLRGPVILSADRRALVFQNDWKAVTELAKAEPDLVLPGWATGRGVTHTIAGTIGGGSETFVAPDGSFSPSNRSYAVTAWVYDRDSNSLHAGERVPIDEIEWRLESGRYPFPQSKWSAGECDVETLLFVREAKFRDERSELVHYRCTISNRGEKPGRLSLFVAVVPFSITREYYAFARGYNAVRELACLPESGAVTVNGSLGIVPLRSPSAFGAASLVGGSYISEFAVRGELPASQRAADWSGLASGALRYDVEVPAGKSESFEFVIPQSGLAPDDEAVEFLRKQEWKKSFNDARDAWKRVFDQEAMKISLPETDVEEGFYASLAYMLVLKDGEALIPGSFAYNAFWTRDAAYLIDACLRAGLTNVARKATEIWVGFQKNSGQFPSMGTGGPSEWDSQGEAMYAFVQVYRYGHDKKWLAEHFPRLLQGARFIDDIRQRGMTDKNQGTPCWGILTESVSAEDLGPPNWHFYWDDFWCIRGLQDALFAAEELGEAAAAEEIRRILNDLHNSTLASIRQVMKESSIDYIPVAPESTSASGRARGTTPAVWPGGALAPDDPLVLRSFENYWQTLIAPKEGGYYHGGQPWPYATIEMAHAYLNIGQPDRAYTMLRWTLDNQSAPGVYAWAEVADGKSKLFLGGDIPHGWASAEYVSLVRDMLVREVGDTIRLTEGVPADWLAHGRNISIERAKTHFGTIGYQISSRAARGEIEMRLSGDATPHGGIVWCVPPLQWPVEAVLLDDVSIEPPPDRRIRIPAGTERVLLKLTLGEPDAMIEPERARMQAWKSGMGDVNIYASVDDERPLMGVYFYFEGADARTNQRRLRSAREAFDFLQIGPSGSNVRRCEEAGVPWMGVEQPAIPLGRDSEQWNSARSVIRSRIKDYGEGYYLLGWNAGSEPHVSFKTPGYTGHSEKLYDELGVAPPTRDEFLEWLREQYADISPADDSNGDGITFNADFAVSLDRWEAVADPTNRRTPWFEHVLIPFTCKLIHDAEAGRLKIFSEADPDHKVTPRLLRSLTDPRMAYDLTYLHLGDAAGVTFYCGGGFNMSDPNDTGSRVETRGLWHDEAFRFGVRLMPPQRGRAGVAQSSYRLLLPDKPGIVFRASLKSMSNIKTECRVELVEDLDQPEGTGRLLLTRRPGDAFEPIEIDLSSWAGRRVWLRLVCDPGAQSPVPVAPDTAAEVYWLEPRVDVAGRIWSDLVEFYKEARAGYRLYDDRGQLGQFVLIGLQGSMYQAWYADHVMSLVANRARLAGKRAVPNEFHPGSGSPHAMFPLAIYDSMIRLMLFRCPSVAYFCHMHQGQFTNYSMAHSEEHVARARNQAILWNAYPHMPDRRPAKVACFMPSNFATPQQAKEAAAQFGTKGSLVWAMGELGADFYLLNDLDRAAEYDRIVIYLAYADREAEAKLRGLLAEGFPGKKVLILTGVSKLWGPVGRRGSKQIDACWADQLPVSPMGENLVDREATILTDLRATMRMADIVHVQEVPGFESIRADDGTVVGARNGNVLCLAGFPETPLEERLARGWFDTTMRRLVHRWLDVRPETIDMGAIKVVNSDLTATEPAIYCIENSSVVKLGPGLAGYDVLHQNPVEGFVFGPAVLRVWPIKEPRLVDTDLCEPITVSQTPRSIEATVLAPAYLESRRDGAVVIYWPGVRPHVHLNDVAVEIQPMANGFYRIEPPASGPCRLMVRP